MKLVLVLLLISNIIDLERVSNMLERTLLKCIVTFLHRQMVYFLKV